MQERKVKWLKAQLTSSLPTEDKTIEDRIILIGGSPFKLKEELGEKHEQSVLRSIR